MQQSKRFDFCSSSYKFEDAKGLLSRGRWKAIQCSANLAVRLPCLVVYRRQSYNCQQNSANDRSIHNAAWFTLYWHIFYFSSCRRLWFGVHLVNVPRTLLFDGDVVFPRYNHGRRHSPINAHCRMGWIKTINLTYCGLFYLNSTLEKALVGPHWCESARRFIGQTRQELPTTSAPKVDRPSILPILRKEHLLEERQWLVLVSRTTKKFWMCISRWRVFECDFNLHQQ